MGIMTEEGFRFYQLLRDDPRYSLEAYQLVQDALGYAQKVLLLGDSDSREFDLDDDAAEHHLTGQQLCRAVKLYAQDQYGYMARLVLRSMGLDSTDAIGDVVYNLINIGCMKKSKRDKREHFSNVFDFEDEFITNFDFQQSLIQND